eukprot:3311099-Prymnesium_polylepis.2
MPASISGASASITPPAVCDTIASTSSSVIPLATAGTLGDRLTRWGCGAVLDKKAGTALLPCRRCHCTSRSAVIDGA